MLLGGGGAACHGDADVIGGGGGTPCAEKEKVNCCSHLNVLALITDFDIRNTLYLTLAGFKIRKLHEHVSTLLHPR